MTESNGILTQTELAEITGYSRPADIERCLHRQGVRVLRGKRGLFTTLSAVELALGLDRGRDNSGPGADVRF